MWIIKINGIDSSSHTQFNDALLQKERFITNGILENNIQIIEQETFSPPSFK